MIIRNVSRHDLDNALAAANLPYAGEKAKMFVRGFGGTGFDGNIKFKRCDKSTRGFHNYDEPTTYNVTLTVYNSHGPGSRMNTEGTRHIKAACWHAHGAFMRALPPAAIVKSNAGGTYEGHKYIAPPAWSPGDDLRDYNIGSITYPCMASEACEC